MSSDAQLSPIVAKAEARPTAYRNLRDALFGRLYLAFSFFILLYIVFWQSQRFQVFGSGYMLGWDNPNYVRLANELLGTGFVQSVRTWAYPQFYVQFLGGLGVALGNVTLADRILPVAFGFLATCAVFLVVLEMTSNVHLAGVSSILQASAISFLKLVSGNDRNLMAFSLIFVTILLVHRTWTRKSGLREYIMIGVLSGIIAYSSFETFLIFSLTIVISAILTRRSSNILGSIAVTTVPVIVLFAALPSYLLTYAQVVQSPIPTPKQVVGPADLYYWMGGSAILAVISLLGVLYTFYRWRKTKEVLSLLLFVWNTILIAIFVAADLRIAGLQAEYGVRALLLLPAYVLIPIAAYFLWSSFVPVIQLAGPRIGRLRTMTVVKTLAVFLMIAIVLSSTAFGVSESTTYFNPYISANTYNKIVQTTNYLTQAKLAVPAPVFVFYGSSGYDSLYRGYIGALLGEHFVYYGLLSNLLQLKISAPNSTDPYTASLETLLSRSYLDELTGNYSGPTEFGHTSFVRSTSELMTHSIVLITPEFYDFPTPASLANYTIGNGIYIVPPSGFAKPQSLETEPVSKEVQGSASAPTLPPEQSYSPWIDEISLVVTAAIFVVALFLAYLVSVDRTKETIRAASRRLVQM